MKEIKPKEKLELDINWYQGESIRQIAKIANGSHYIDIIARIDGQDKHFEADWLKKFLQKYEIIDNGNR